MKALKRKYIETDVLIIGGGTAGCGAAIALARRAPRLRVVALEKANLRRSGCLAAGVNALNAHINPGRTVQDYLEYVRRDAEKIVRDDLILSMAERFNAITEELERMGLVFLKDDEGRYVARGKRNLKINGENIKTILENEVRKGPSTVVLNHVNATDLLKDKSGAIVGAVGFSVNFEEAFIVSAKAVLVATGGAAGLYRPNNPGFSRHKMWYSPFNTGAGYAMGIRAGAEMTSLEMRFVAQRIKDTIAPTGTIALGVGAKEINSQGEFYASKYGLSTNARAYGAANENYEGRGPCRLKTTGISHETEEDLYRAYLNMAPAQTLKWIESNEPPSKSDVEIEGTEPYIVGGHTGSGYWIDAGRRTTLKGLYAAGDVAGGAPKKFVTGALAEGQIAAESILADLNDIDDASSDTIERLAEPFVDSYERKLNRDESKWLFPVELEEAMQKIMDNYAGGISASYRYNEARLDVAEERIRVVERLVKSLRAYDMDDLLQVYELTDRLTVCRALIAHLRERRETRWPGFGVRSDYPNVDEKFELFVNSRLVDGKIQMIRRELTGKETVRER